MRPWWERGGVLALLCLAVAIPLAWPAVPPLTDLPGHMARYHVALDGGATPSLARAYDYRWAPIGNLGVDLAVMPLGALIGVEAATRVVVALIPVLTAAGMLAVARAAHGRVPATALFPLPLAYAWPLQLGFVNFCLGMALALLALAGWIALGRRERPVVRALVFAGAAWGLWLAHSFAWGAFGLWAFGAEVARRREGGERWRDAVPRATAWCLPLATPVFAMLGSAGGGAEWIGAGAKLAAVAAALRDHWLALDLLSVLALLAVPLVAWRERLGVSPLLGWPALLSAVASALLPHKALGGAYVDTRLAPYALALLLLAIRPTPARGWAAAGLAFVAVRLAATTASFALNGAAMARELDALPTIPRGAAVFALSARPCEGGWDPPRFDHLGGMAIVRRDGFVNDQWAIPGQQLLSVRDTGAAPFDRDPSELASDHPCGAGAIDLDAALRRFPRGRYDYVWTIGFPPGRVRDPELVRVWSSPRSALYRIARATPR